jgi:MFS family permease
VGGDSLGGYVALASASALPHDQLRGLVLAGASANFVGPALKALQRRWLSIRLMRTVLSERLLSAMVAAVNMGGNVASGRYLARGVPARRLLWIGFGAMAVGSVVAFAPAFDGAGLWVRFAAVCVFSGVGGLIPGTLFSLGVRVAPGEDTVSTTVGWMQQWSSLGQFAGPPVAAWLASRVGDWSMTWCITLACAAVGAMLAASLIRRPAS